MNEAFDNELTALLDGQLREPERSEMFRRLAADSGLRDRLDALAGARGPLDAVFAGMLSEAPTARLGAGLPGESRAASPARGDRIRMAVGFAVAAIVGAALAVLVTLNVAGEKDDWTSAVVDYMGLYTSETFAGLHTDAALEAILVQAVGARLGAHITPQDLAVPGLSFKTAFVLAYEGTPLGEFAFTDSSGAPNLFCVLADGSEAKPLRLEKRGAYTLATWARDGKRFLVIGPSREFIDNWAHAVAGRVS